MTSGDTLLSFRQALQSPCLTCTDSPCCKTLLLGTVELRTLLEVDHALYLLNFEGIYLTLGSTRDRALVYLYQPCGHLDTGSGLCTVHSTPAQPSVCVSYKSHTCDYRWVFGEIDDPTAPVLDHARMSWLAERMVFDQERAVEDVPSMEEIAAAFADMPLNRTPAPVPPNDALSREWQAVTLSERRSARAESRYSFDDPAVTDPCTGCAAWCCHTLRFPRDIPLDSSQLDFLRYMLGFPSVELSISEDRWSLLVHTTCRHLSGGRCALFGRPERPLECSAFDELQCSYRVEYGAPADEAPVRISLAEFPVLAQLIVFDQHGRVRGLPAADVVRDALPGPDGGGRALGSIPVDPVPEEGGSGQWL